MVWNLSPWTVLLALCALIHAEHWDYCENGPSVWSETYPECDGEMQSPIALSRRDALPVTGEALLSAQSAVTLHDYDKSLPTTFSNNGHTVNLDFNYTFTNKNPRVVISHHGSEDTYFLQALHFHWPSEHEVDGVKFPLEMHMVHKLSDNVTTLVLGYLFKSCERRPERWYSHSSRGLKQLAEVIRGLERYGASVVRPLFTPGSLMPTCKRVCDYFTYQGSLTTPPCTEGVTWLVKPGDSVCVEESQLKTFYKVLDEKDRPLLGNVRPLQSTNNRKVQFIQC